MAFAILALRRIALQFQSRGPRQGKKLRSQGSRRSEKISTGASLIRNFIKNSSNGLIHLTRVQKPIGAHSAGLKTK